MAGTIKETCVVVSEMAVSFSPSGRRVEDVVLHAEMAEKRLDPRPENRVVRAGLFKAGGSRLRRVQLGGGREEHFFPVQGFCRFDLPHLSILAKYRGGSCHGNHHVPGEKSRCGEKNGGAVAGMIPEFRMMECDAVPSRAFTRLPVIKTQSHRIALALAARALLHAPRHRAGSDPLSPRSGSRQ